MVKGRSKEMYKKSNRIICMGLMLCMTSAMVLGGCGQKSENSGKIEIELVQYKPEAVKTFEKIESLTSTLKVAYIISSIHSKRYNMI